MRNYLLGLGFWIFQLAYVIILIIDGKPIPSTIALLAMAGCIFHYLEKIFD